MTESSHWPSNNDVAEMFFDAKEEFGEHKSTTFLASIVADRLGWELDDVFQALVNSDYCEET